MKKLPEWLKRIFVYTIMFYLIVVGYAYFFADSYIFNPPPASYQDNDKILKLKTQDGAIISAVYFYNPRAKYTILYSHGNAVDIGQLTTYFEYLQKQGFSVLAYDYHGYGTSTGKPSEKNVYYDIDAAYDYLVITRKISPQTIIAYGKSLGAALAIDLAARKPLGGLIIENSFISAYRTITYIPLLPFDKFSNLSKLAKINCPILVIHGEQDQIVPHWHGKKLYALAKSPKVALWIAEAGHNDSVLVAGKRYPEAIQKFMRYVEQQSMPKP